MRLKQVLIFCWLVCSQPAYAALDLELTQGNSAALPIAIVPFTGPKTVLPGDITVTQVIKHDLQNSGQFRVTGPEGITQNVSSSSQKINARFWQKQGVNDVVVGAIHPLSGGQYQVAFTVTNVFSGAQAKDADNVLLSQSFRVDASGLRGLAHHISDLIYQKLTGIRGVFSTKVAYILVRRSHGGASKYSLEVADIDGFNPQSLLISNQPIMSPAWSPDGKRLAYVSFEQHRASVYIQDMSTGERQLVSDAPGINGAPAFSPDGKQLALVLTKTGNPKIYALDLGTKRLKEITFGWSIDTEPAWAPDARSLLFTSNRDGNPQIYSYSFLTGKVARVTYSGNYNARASFTPNEEGIVMMHRENGLFGIAQQDLATGRVQVLAQTGADESPSLAPNGKMVIYATEYGERGVLAQVSVDGRIKARLPAREGTVQEPAWSPFLN